MLKKCLGTFAMIGLASLLVGFEQVDASMDVKLTTARNIAGPLSYSCPTGVETNSLSLNFSASRISNLTSGTWDIMAGEGPGPHFKNGTIQNITLSKNNYYILGQENADNICRDPVPLSVVIYGQCNANSTIHYGQSNAETISFGPSYHTTHCLFGPLISHNPLLLYNCPRNILNCL